MKKEAILEKSKEENQYADERERQEMRNSFALAELSFVSYVFCSA